MAERYRVTITPRAIEELMSICSYVELESPQAAAAIAQDLLDAIDSLVLFPRRFKVHERRKEAGKIVHSMPVRPFLVYYRVDDRNSLVEVLSVRHGKRLQPKRFS